MAFAVADRVRETTTTTGTGTLNLDGAVSGFRTFVSGIGDGNVTYYAIVHRTAAEFEIGIGTVTDASTDTLSRTTVLSSSNSNSAVNFSAGTKDVFCTQPASKAVFEDNNADVTLPDDLILGSDSAVLKFGADSDITLTHAADTGLTLNGTFAATSVTANSGVVVDNITIDGTEIDLSSGDLTLDVAGDIILDADGANVTVKDGGTTTLDIVSNGTTDVTLDAPGDIALDADGGDVFFKDGGTTFGSATNTSGNLIIKSGTTTALTFSGADVTIAGDLTISGDDLTMGTNTAGHLLIADGTNFNPVAVGSLSEISAVANDDVFLAVDTSGGGLKKITRSTIVSGLAASGAAISNVVEDTTPQLGGSLDVNGEDIVSVSNGNITLTPNGTGVVRVDGSNGIDMQSGAISIKNSGAESYIRFYCESSNAHYTQLQAAPHSAYSGNVTVVLPASADTLVGRDTTDTLTNKTLTSPKINEDVAVTSTATEINILDGVTATTAELNIMDGVTATTAELNIMDGVTATTAELNIMDGVTSTAAELNILDGVTSTAAELNILDGVTSTTAELNILDGVTSTTAELNILDGVTSTAAELNILDGVTSTAAELNLLDGDTSVGSSITLADGDGIVTNDGGTMKTIPASDVKTYVGAAAGAFSIANLDIDGGTDINADLVGDDLIIVDDGAGGTNRKATLTRLMTFVNANVSGGGGSTAADDISAGDAAINLTTTSGNITIDAQANDSDIIFKGTDGSSDTTFLTIDGSDAGKALFNAGATFSSNVSISTADNTDTLKLISTDADASAGPVLVLDRASGSPADDDLIGRIIYRSRNDAGEELDLVKTSCFIADASDGTEDAQFEIDQRIAGTYRNMLTMSSSAIIFNEDAQDIDFRVESSGNANAFKVDAGNDKIVVDVSFDLNDNKRIRLGDGNDLQIYHSGSSSYIINDTGDLTLDLAADLVIDADGADIRFEDGGSGIGRFTNSSSDFVMQVDSQDKDILFKGDDGGSAITGVQFDMSDAGAIICKGNVTAFGSPSDIRLKENIEVIPNALDKVSELRGVTFNYKKDGKKSTGLIAQELEKVLPEVVYDTHEIDNDDEKFKAVRYGNVVGLLVEAIKELKFEIEELKKG